MSCRRVVLGVALLLSVVPSCAVPVDLNAVPIAKASCEEPSADLLLPDPRMLPGRICQQCHTRGGQGYRFKWSISGTIFSRLDSPCNTGGAAGVKIEILDKNGNLQVELESNDVGNFWTDKTDLSFPVRARITKEGTVREMMTPAEVGSCASCHQSQPKGNAPGPMYIGI